MAGREIQLGNDLRKAHITQLPDLGLHLIVRKGSLGGQLGVRLILERFSHVNDQGIHAAVAQLLHMRIPRLAEKAKLGRSARG